MGAAAIENLIGERRKNGKFVSLFDFSRRVDSRTNNRKVIETLIRCGAFDSLGALRSQMMAVVDQALSTGAKVQREEEAGQMSFFSMEEDSGGFTKQADVYPPMKEFPQSQLLAFEKELLGFYLSGHPLDRYKVETKTFTNASVGKLRRMSEGQPVSLIALISQIKLTVTKKTGERMAILGFEDLEGAVEALVFPKAYQQIFRSIKAGAIVVVKGKLSLKEESPKILVDDLCDINEIYRLIKAITIDMTKAGPEKLVTLRKRLERFPGTVPVHLQINDKSYKSFEIKVGRDLNVSPSEVLMEEIKSIVGEEAFRVVI